MNFQIERLKKLPLRPNERWQGGLYRMPAWVPNADGKLYRPWTGFWISKTTGKISQPLADDEAEHRTLEMALASLVNFACEKGVAGYRPEWLEVKDADIADYLEKVLADTGICVHLRDRLMILDEAIAELTAFIAGQDNVPDALSAKRVTLDMMRSFAAAAAEFYRAKPWRYLCDEDLVAVESPFVDNALRYLSVLGNAGMTYGFGFYDSKKKFERFVSGDGIEAISKGSYWTLFFDGIEELPFGDADLWEEHNFPLASPKAYPLAMSYEPNGKHRRPQPDVLAFMEGLLRAFAQTTEAEIDSGRWEKTVSTFDGDQTYKLALPDLLESAEGARKRNLKQDRLPDRRAMEKIHLDVQRILDGNDFSSMEEMQDFINANIVGKPIPEQHPVTPMEQAQDLCYEAYEARGRKRVQLARKALDICSDCVDAYVILAESDGDPAEAYALYAKGEEAGRRVLGEAFFREEVGHFWGILQSRPYMRARQGMAETLELMGRIDEAIGHFQEMLRLNPSDNQGVRNDLIGLLLKTARLEEAAALLKEYKCDGAAVWNYSRALLTFMQKGDTAIARKHLAKAIKDNPYVVDYLLGEEEAPMPPQGYTIGSQEEAVVCFECLDDAWESASDALKWLEDNAV